MKKLEFTTLVFVTFLVMFTIGKISYETWYYGTGVARVMEVLGFAWPLLMSIVTIYFTLSLGRFLYVLADKPKAATRAPSNKWHHTV